MDNRTWGGVAGCGYDGYTYALPLTYAEPKIEPKEDIPTDCIRCDKDRQFPCRRFQKFVGYCPLKAKEPQKTYPIELKRKSLDDLIMSFVDKYTDYTMTKDELIFQLKILFGAQKAESRIATGYDRCKCCEGTGRITDSKTWHPCPKCLGTGITKEG